MSAEIVIERYLALRERKKELKDAYDASVADIEAAMNRIEGAIGVMLNRQGATSIKTPVGTAYTSVLTNVSVADWDAALAWIKAKQAWDMIEKRVAKSSVEQYRTEHNDLPPGLNWTETRKVNIRRS